MKHTIEWVAAFLLAFGSGPALSQVLEDHCLFGCPTGAPAANKLIVRDIYALSNNGGTKFADWVAYRVNKNNFSQVKRNRNWAKDPDLNANETFVPSNYDDSNRTLYVDRGHQAPLGSFKGAQNWAATNFLSNITPQQEKLNQGPWKKLERAVRDLAKEPGVTDVFVMTGPLYEWPMAKLPATDKHHHVPSGYWKIVAIPDGNTVKAAAFYFYQTTPKKADYCDHMKSIRVIEGKSELDFFSALADDLEETLETSDPTLVDEIGCSG